MFRIYMENENIVGRKIQQLRLREAIFHSGVKALAAEVTIAAQQYLVATLGDAASHFRVVNRGNQYGNTISVVAKDEIGAYIYYGTSPHMVGSPGQVLANEATGFGPVTGPVLHPGTEARKDDIDGIIELARTAVFALRGIL